MSGGERLAIGRVDVGIVVALSLESAAIVERLSGSIAVGAGGRQLHVGRIGTTPVSVIAAGVGRDAARRGTRLLIDGHRPSRIIAAGLCGGLDPSLQRATVVVADRLELDPDMASGEAAGRPATAAPASLPPGWIDRLPQRPARGAVVTAAHVVATVDAKRRLRESTGAAVVDMESWWVVEEASRAGIPAHVIRAVCDTASEDVPADVASLGESQSAARLAGAAVRMLWRRPSAAIDLVELRERAHAAADAVAARVAAMIGGG